MPTTGLAWRAQSRLTVPDTAIAMSHHETPASMQPTSICTPIGSGRPITEPPMTLRNNCALASLEATTIALAKGRLRLMMENASSSSCALLRTSLERDPANNNTRGAPLGKSADCLSNALKSRVPESTG